MNQVLLWLAIQPGLSNPHTWWTIVDDLVASPMPANATDLEDHGPSERGWGPGIRRMRNTLMTDSVPVLVDYCEDQFGNRPQGLANLQAAIEVFREPGLALNLQLGNPVSPCPATGAELFPDMPGSPRILVAVTCTAQQGAADSVSCPWNTPSTWDATAGAPMLVEVAPNVYDWGVWGNVEGELGRVILNGNQGNFGPWLAGVHPDSHMAPSVEVLVHELGHLLGFTEQRWRHPDGAHLAGPTAGTASWGPGQMHAPDPPPLTAYGKQFLGDLYGWSSGMNTESWRVHTTLVGPDPLSPSGQATDESNLGFTNSNPRYIQEGPAGRYVDCRTRDYPEFRVQYSDASSFAATGTVTHRWQIDDKLDNYLLAEVTHDAKPSGPGSTALMQYDWRRSLIFTPTGPLGLLMHTWPDAPTTLPISFVANAVQADAEDTRDDNTRSLDLLIFDRNSDDLRCGTHAMVSSSPRSPSYGEHVVMGHNQLAVTDFDAVEIHRLEMSDPVEWTEVGHYPLSHDDPSSLAFVRREFAGGWRTLVAVGFEGVGAELLVLTDDGVLLDQGWLPQTAGTGSRLGKALTFASSGQHLFLGDPAGAGVVEVIEVPADPGDMASWQTVHQIHPPGAMMGFGAALAHHGRSLVIGAPDTSSGTGALAVWDTDPAVSPVAWTREGWISPAAFQSAGTPLQPGDALGAAVDVRGKVIAVGAPHHDVTGGAWVIRRRELGETPGGTWIIGGKLVGPGTGRLFGASVAVGRRVVVVGAPLGADGGTAHVYRPAWTGDLFPWLRREAGQPLPSWSMYGAGVAADDWLFAVGEPRVASHGEGGVHVEAYGLGPADRTPGGG